MRAWFRNLIAAASWEEFDLYKEQTGRDAAKRYRYLENGIKELDKSTAKWLVELQADHDALKEKTAGQMNVLRELVKNAKQMVRDQDDKIEFMGNEIIQLAAALEGFEFPEFPKIDTKTDLQDS